MYAACQMFGLTAADEILTPAFDCDGSLQPFRVLGAKMCFYRSDPYTFFADIDDIAQKISPRTKLIHVINHFGMPQPWDKLIALRNKAGIPILEDNAYSLFSKFNGMPFGSFGDLAIFSLRKNLPLVDGGLLRINNNRYTYSLPNKKPALFYRWETFNLLRIIKNNLGLNNIHGIITQPPPLFSDKEGYPEWSLRDAIGQEFSCNYLRPMSKLARRQLSLILQAEYDKICHKKRDFYALLVQGLAQVKGIHILWPKLPEGAIPFCLSLLVEKNRDLFLETLRKKYSVMAWPTLSYEVLGRLRDFPEVELLGRKLLQLNLPADRVTRPKFTKYIENLLGDINAFASRFLSG